MKAPSVVASRLRRAAGLLPPSRSVQIRPRDTVLVSYPRSGNTWMRFIVANICHPHVQHSFDTVERFTPDIYRMAARDLARTPDPRILKSHEPFDARYPRVVYVVRDPRDVAVSYFHYRVRSRSEAEEGGLDGWVEAFTSRGEGHYGTWVQHVEGWLSQRQASQSFLLVRYEDLLRETHIEVGRLATFLGATDTDVERVVADASAREMRSVESRAGAAGSLVRKGISGGWRNELSEEAARRIRLAFGPTMDALGYVA